MNQLSHEIRTVLEAFDNGVFVVAKPMEAGEYTYALSVLRRAMGSNPVYVSIHLMQSHDKDKSKP